MDFKQNYYQLFDLPVSYDVDPVDLKSRYHALMNSVHPDRHVDENDHQRRLALQYATLINEAFETLTDPLKSAIYLMSLRGVDIARDESPELDPGFLMEQIELRESLDEISENADLDNLAGFKAQMNNALSALQSDFRDELGTVIDTDADGDFSTATGIVHRMQFMHKLYLAADQLEERLLEY